VRILIFFDVFSVGAQGAIDGLIFDVGIMLSKQCHVPLGKRAWIWALHKQHQARSSDFLELDSAKHWIELTGSFDDQ
jgi:hypothetical protein